MSSRKVQSGKAAIFWFRKGLRLHDNPALLHCLAHSTTIYPIFILDPFFVKSSNVGPNRWRFLFEALEDLDHSLRKCSSRLFLLQGKPEVVLAEKLKEWKIDLLGFERDTEPYSKYRDGIVADICKKSDVDIFSSASHTLYDPEMLYQRNGKEVTKTYAAFGKLMNKVGPP